MSFLRLNRSLALFVFIFFSCGLVGGEIYQMCINERLNGMDLEADCYRQDGQLRWGVWINLENIIKNDDGYLEWEQGLSVSQSCNKIGLGRDFRLQARCEQWTARGTRRVFSSLDLSQRIVVEDGWMVYDDGRLPDDSVSCTSADYIFDETSVYPRHSCKTDCDCNGERRCSGANWCEEKPIEPVIVY